VAYCQDILEPYELDFLANMCLFVEYKTLMIMCRYKGRKAEGD
jgi:hypothetical protein